MPTGSDPAGSDRGNAVARARREAIAWADLAEAWGRERRAQVWADLPPLETAVIPGVDSRSDLDRRAQPWGFTFAHGALPELATFAAGLAQAEADAWGDPSAGSVATRAYADRRFFLADRVLPWLVPWFDTVGRCYPELRTDAHEARDWLLALGEEMRPAPALAGTEGLALPGHDGYGPLAPGPLVEVLGSLWGGAIVLHRTASSIAGRSFPTRAAAIAHLAVAHPEELRHHYEAACGRWRRYAAAHPGTASYWSDLAARAATTVNMLGG